MDLIQLNCKVHWMTVSWSNIQTMIINASDLSTFTWNLDSLQLVYLFTCLSVELVGTCYLKISCLAVELCAWWNLSQKGHIFFQIYVEIWMVKKWAELIRIFSRSCRLWLLQMSLLYAVCKYIYTIYYIMYILYNICYIIHTI